MQIINEIFLEALIINPNLKKAKQQLLAWKNEIKKEDWRNPNELKAKYGSASVLKNNRVVFNICGNNYRLIVDINYPIKIVYIIWFGTHKEYDNIIVESL